MTQAQIRLGDQPIILDPSGAAFLSNQKILVVSDLHLEKSSSGANRGHLLPPGDSTDTLARLEELVTLYAPETLISLGDSFHDKNAIHRLSAEDAATLSALSRRVPICWVTGNHDPVLPSALAGTVMDDLHLGPLIFRHIPSGAAEENTAEIAGHLHPKVRLRLRGHTLSRKCFISNDRCLIMPAFGRYTGGLEISHPAFQSLFPGTPRVHVLGKDRVYHLA